MPDNNPLGKILKKSVVLSELNFNVKIIYVEKTLFFQFCVLQ